MKVLVVEDERRLADYLRQGLTEAGYTVEVAVNGVDGLHLASTGDHDLVVLDRVLPGIDGIALLTALRGTHRTPVLMLTARAEVEDRVSGLQAGADDYLSKPFAFPELLARVQALLRRSSDGGAGMNEASTSLRLANLEIDLLRRRVWRAGQRIDLSAKEFNLLTLLCRRQGEVLSRTEIASLVWDMNFDSETNVVEVAIRRLRAKVDVPFKARLLHTVRGMGYVMEDRTE